MESEKKTSGLWIHFVMLAVVAFFGSTVLVFITMFVREEPKLYNVAFMTQSDSVLMSEAIGSIIGTQFHKLSFQLHIHSCPKVNIQLTFSFLTSNLDHS